MEIEVITRPKDKQELILATAQYYARVLNLESSKFSLIIQTVTGLAKDSGMNGAITKLGDRTLYMMLDSRLRDEQMFLTLAHEMVHAKQHAKGQLKVFQKRNGDPYFKWLGRKFTTEYFDCPWELEAFSRERILANKIAQILMKK